MNKQLTVRQMIAADCTAIDTIQRQVYVPALQESPAVLRNKQALSPATCWVLADHQDILIGYLYAHYWADADTPPPLDTEQTEATGSLLFIHDLTIAPSYQGLGLSRLLWQTFVRYAQTKQVTDWLLVAVNGSVPFWQRRGFRSISVVAPEKGYGADARLMRQ